MVTAKTVLLVTSLLILMGVSNEKKMKCTARVTMWYHALSECRKSGRIAPELRMKTLTFKLYNKQSRVVLQSWFFEGERRHFWFNVNMSYDPETDGIGLHFYLYHEDNQSMNDNPGRSGLLYRAHSYEPKFANRTFGQGTDLSELYYTRPGIVLPSAIVNCSGTMYPLWDFEEHKCKIADLVVGNHGAYEITENPPSLVPVYYTRNNEGDLYYF